MRNKLLAFVHSNVNIYLLKHYIITNKIEPDDIIILYHRVTLKDLDVLPGRKILYESVFKSGKISIRNISGFFSVVDQFIEKEIKSNFTFVVPHFTRDIFQAISTHKACEMIVYLEEGDLSYVPNNTLSLTYASSGIFNGIFRRIFSLGRLFNKHPFPKTNKYEEGIGLNVKVFPSKNIKKHLYDIKEVFNNPEYPYSHNFNNAIIFLIEGDSKKNPHYIQYYKIALERAFKTVASDLGKIVYVKPHPNLYRKPHMIDEFISLANQCGLHTIVINDPIELILANFVNVRLVAFHTSLFIYCYWLGQKPYLWGKELITEKEITSNPNLYNFVKDNPEGVLKFI